MQVGVGFGGVLSGWGRGFVAPPADFRVRWTPAEGAIPAGGEIDADGIDLAPLARLAEYLRLPRAARARLEATDPRGSVRNLKAAWTGDAEDPQHYSARGGFARLAARAHDGIPGFAGLTGRFEASEKGGNVVLGSERAAIELPGILAESPVRIDLLGGQISWKLAPDRFEFGLQNLSVANGDLAATFTGSFAGTRGGPNVIDLTGNFSRADRRAVYRYVPRLPAPAAE